MLMLKTFPFVSKIHFDGVSEWAFNAGSHSYMGPEQDREKSKAIGSSIKPASKINITAKDQNRG